MAPKTFGTLLQFVNVSHWISRKSVRTLMSSFTLFRTQHDRVKNKVDKKLEPNNHECDPTMSPFAPPG